MKIIQLTGLKFEIILLNERSYLQTNSVSSRENLLHTKRSWSSMHNFGTNEPKKKIAFFLMVVFLIVISTGLNFNLITKFNTN